MTGHVDVVIIGAGLSGIGAACRLQTQCRNRTYAVLEARQAMGGTWDLFRYPGVRSDSDMYTLGYSFRPWRDSRALANGASILAYIRETAAEFGIGEHIRYSTKVVAADFSSATGRWTLTVEEGDDGGRHRSTLTCDFLYSCAGYFNYGNGHDPQLPGRETFAGAVLQPQFWPEDADYAGKRVVVIGSGATAVTLVPAMSAQAEHVTMLQRSPTWISAVPGTDQWAERIKKLMPPKAAHRLIRTKNIVFSVVFYAFCQRLPGLARRVLLRRAGRELGDSTAVARHFTPRYDPWDQRLCAVPDGDFFRAMKSGDVDVVTEAIEAFVPEGLRLASGRVLPADVVVCATGLELQAFGGIEPQVDGEKVDLEEQFVWHGAMVTGLPNFAVCIGYTNASWTLRADLSHRLVCKVLNWMQSRGHAAVVPVPPRKLRPLPLLDLAAGYIQRSISAFPRQGNRGPWRVRQNYIIDAAATLGARPETALRPVRPVAAGSASQEYWKGPDRLEPPTGNLRRQGRMDGRGVEQYRRRMERAARMRAAAAGGDLDSDDVERATAEEELRHGRRKVDDAAKADYLIRDAMARGDFDNLKYAGKPIPNLGDGHDPDWWIKGLMQRENVTGLGPRAILLRTEDAGLDARLDTRWTEKQVREMVEDFNARIIDARRQLEGGPPVVTPTRDVEQEVLRWRERRAAAAEHETAAAPEPEQRRPWWKRFR